MTRPRRPGPNHGRSGFEDAVERFWNLMETEGGVRRRPALEWIRRGVALHLGEDWFEAALARPELFKETFFLPCHHGLLIDGVERTIRLEELDGCEGFARTRQQLRKDVKLDTLVHGDAVMEVATLARSAGATIRFEVRLGSLPVDLVVGEGDDRMPIEVTAVHLDQPFRAADERTTYLGDAARGIGFRHKVEIDLAIHQLPDDDERFLDALREAVRSASDMPAKLSISGIDVTLRTGGMLGSLTGPDIETNYIERVAARIAQKAAKDYAPRPVWLRVEVLNGMWAFPRWAQAGMRSKLESLRSALVPTLDAARVAGLVLTPGALSARGLVIEESHDVDGCWAIRRNLAGWRAREVIVLTVDPRWDGESEMWRAMYESEPRWLEEAVRRHGLPDVEDLY